MSTLFHRATSATLLLTLMFSVGVIKASAAEHEDAPGPCPDGEQLVQVWCITHQTHHFTCYPASAT